MSQLYFYIFSKFPQWDTNNYFCIIAESPMEAYQMLCKYDPWHGRNRTIKDYVWWQYKLPFTQKGLIKELDH
jgi:hypothetical protein